MTNNTIALIYDFDGTLSPKNMQEFGFIQAIGNGVEEFWQRTTQMSRQHDASSILCYMYQMIQSAKMNNISLRRESFAHFGSQVELYPGVQQWFASINAYGETQGLEVKHYIISSGLKEMIEGTSIAKEFERIYASSYMYDVDGVAFWPAVAVDYTQKTQFLYKINKGISEVYDSRKINEFYPEEERPIPFSHMIYFGDGETDVPCMQLVKRSGGHSIAVFNNECHADIAQKLIHDGRVNYACPANYNSGELLFATVKDIIEKFK